jgi:2-hydroxy-6-oxonona-2,4-dienedioate hydrolase
MQAVIDKLLTSYDVVGKGSQTILALHGWADSGKTFRPLAEQIVKENSDYSIVLVDLPGFGATQPPHSAWGLGEYGIFVKHFLEKIKKQPGVIIGHSNGGAIAIHGLAGGVLETEKLVLIGSAGIREKSASKTLLRVLAKPAKLAVKAAPKTTRQNIKRKLYSAIGSDYLIAEHMQDSFKLTVAADVKHDARKINIPTCLIYGEDDTSTPPAYGRIFNSLIPKSELTIVPMTGHFVHQEQVYKVASVIKEFIAE